MADASGALKQIVETLIDRFEKLHELLLAEREALRNRDAEALESANASVRESLEEISRIDQRRQRLTIDMAHVLGLSGGVPSMGDLARKLGEKSGFMALREQLRTAIDAAQKANRENQAAFRGVQTATEAVMEVIRSGGTPQTSGYGRTGAKATAGAFHTFSKQL
ncbi:flagellar protein FlgN [Magnetofaba australis]|uniref:FlgN family protein n=1 Tax=Magnetofaba australis IT-1 TaxID=1434232 RepID=A0A1Y2K367_9PROT|nr:flagellar protein FlgN [Magnetofaba australis]OSM02399.1 hypothetical protein MAIT1_02538 [Magnetofaba australis IT-1]